MRSDVFHDSKRETEDWKLDAVPRYRRRIVTIHGKSVVGFSVAVHELSDEELLLLQAGAVMLRDNGHIKWQSMFSRRAIGRGVFDPVEIAEDPLSNAARQMGNEDYVMSIAAN